ncbi:hypothetical protein CU102_22285 [Phyllobacterium brassicacearum]|uniref:Uncharacterized protein n=1 Tax=Phyllobacterium brassicacearum TaxID=314235 RepID=A0A2P7BCQ3_9HYPH|nr:hypothetical protein [Phyllobacterium brassicacearum]PSH64257.1 hypothetical protein CU102_22285 [Phyllobacterium brassicacearum]
MSANQASPQIYEEEPSQIHSLESMACSGWPAIQLHDRFADLTAGVVAAREPGISAPAASGSGL